MQLYSELFPKDESDSEAESVLKCDDTDEICEKIKNDLWERYKRAEENAFFAQQHRQSIGQWAMIHHGIDESCKSDTPYFLEEMKTHRKKLRAYEAVCRHNVKMLKKALGAKEAKEDDAIRIYMDTTITRKMTMFSFARLAQYDDAAVKWASGSNDSSEARKILDATYHASTATKLGEWGAVKTAIKERQDVQKNFVDAFITWTKSYMSDEGCCANAHDARQRASVADGDAEVAAKMYREVNSSLTVARAAFITASEKVQEAKDAIKLGVASTDAEAVAKWDSLLDNYVAANTAYQTAKISANDAQRKVSYAKTVADVTRDIARDANSYAKLEEKCSANSVASTDGVVH